MIKKAVKNMLNHFGIDVVRLHHGLRCWPEQRQLALTDYETDEVFHERYDRAQEMTQMRQSDNALRRMRHYTLMKLLDNADLNNGDICELGCFRGLSSWQISCSIRDRKSNGTFHIFDSFQGLSEIEEIDMPEDRSQDSEALREQFACSLEQVKANLSEFNFITYHKGWIPERFGEVEDIMFSFVHIDVDLYQPIYDSISFFFPRLIDGGTMVFDDYGYLQFPGAKKAVDDYLGANPAFFVPLPSGQAFLIKQDG